MNKNHVSCKSSNFSSNPQDSYKKPDVQTSVIPWQVDTHTHTHFKEHTNYRCSLCTCISNNLPDVPTDHIEHQEHI